MSKNAFNDRLMINYALRHCEPEGEAIQRIEHICRMASDDRPRNDDAPDNTIPAARNTLPLRHSCRNLPQASRSIGLYYPQEWALR